MTKCYKPAAVSLCKGSPASCFRHFVEHLPYIYISHTSNTQNHQSPIFIHFSLKS
ncbi:hypothetical protein Hanom_Chr05g00466321 [Helianthus anomalus]